MKRTRTKSKVKRESGYSRLSANCGTTIGRVNIVFSGHPEGKNNYDYNKYKILFKGY